MLNEPAQETRDDWRDRVEKMLHDIHDVVMGEKGSPGLMEGHRDHERRIQSLEKSEAEREAALHSHKSWINYALLDKIFWLVSTIASSVICMYIGLKWLHK